MEPKFNLTDKGQTSIANNTFYFTYFEFKDPITF